MLNRLRRFFVSPLPPREPTVSLAQYRELSEKYRAVVLENMRLKNELWQRDLEGGRDV